MSGGGAVARIGVRAVAGARSLALGALASLGALPLVAITMLVSGVLRDGTADVTMHGRYHIWGLVAAAVLALGVARLRWVAGLTRRLVGRWCGVMIADPYRPAPPAGPGGRRRRIGGLLTDPATWRDLLWICVNVLGGLLLVVTPMGVVLYGLGALDRLHGSSGPEVLPLPDQSVASAPQAPSAPAPDPSAPVLPTQPQPPWSGITSAVLHPGVLGFWAAVVLGAALLVVGLLVAPRLLAGHGRLAAALLGPTREVELARRVSHLAATRSDTIDSGAAEMRRIERDLHDGAQARLVAMGMTLNAAEQLFDSSPDAARALLAEAKQSSVKALAELRDLVRGIHPPVLADRGLFDAVRALALDLPLRVRLDGELSARAPAPVESAAYFAVNELLANISKHAGADQVWIEIGHTGGTLRIVVTDNGRGGADPSRGTGLRGLERRLAAFDGVLAVSSPPGGPTIISLEIPCALSSPKTSSC